MARKEFSFEKGWSQLKIGEAPKVKAEIMDALHIKGNCSFYRRKNGEVEHKLDERRTIERVFARHGIKEVWNAKI